MSKFEAPAVAGELLLPTSSLVEVDFCRGPAGAFLAIDNLVVAGDCAGGGRTIQSFVVDRAQILRALEGVNSVAQAGAPIATDRAK